MITHLLDEAKVQRFLIKMKRRKMFHEACFLGE